MSLVISRDFALAQASAPGADNAVIGYRSIATAASLAADTAALGFPALNLVNPATYLYWRASDATEQHIAITTGSADDLDFIAVAGHNLASASIPLTVEGHDGDDWFELVQQAMLSDDGPALFRFAPQPLTQIRLKLGEGIAPAQIAVLYAGKLLITERGIWQGQTPMPHGRVVRVTNGRAEAGAYLGRIITQEQTRTRVPLNLITPDFYRSDMHPFVLAARTAPFFFAWRPQTYPREVGYGWLAADPVPVNESPHGLVAVTLDVAGIV